MSLVLSGLTQRLIAAWVALYTLGLPPEHRDQRRMLICADVYEQVQDARDQGVGSIQLTLALAERAVRGILGDVSWRLWDAPNFPRTSPGAPIDWRQRMQSGQAGTVFLATSALLAWLVIVALIAVPVSGSLAVVGSLVALVALSGWVLEARAEDEEAPASPWPLLLGAGITSVAGSFVFTDPWLGFPPALILAVVMSFATVRRLSRHRGDEQAAAGAVSTAELSRRAALGEAIAIEAPYRRGVTRRAVLRGSFGLGMASALAAMGGIVTDFLWRRNVSGFGAVVRAGPAASFPPGSKTRVPEGKFWLVRLTEAQGGPGFLALWQKCPHLGCVVPWNERFTHVDPDTGRPKEGWFRCPCHQSTYNDAGVRVYGPAPRSMDRMALRITDGIIEVDTGDISNGADDNAAHAVNPDT